MIFPATGKGVSIWTAWRKALGRSAIQRYYAVIEVDGKDLGEELVSAGLARIHGVRITRPDGTVSRTHLLKLQFMESEAKKKGLGGWDPKIRLDF